MLQNFCWFGYKIFNRDVWKYCVFCDFCCKFWKIVFCWKKSYVDWLNLVFKAAISWYTNLFILNKKQSNNQIIFLIQLTSYFMTCQCWKLRQKWRGVGRLTYVSLGAQDIAYQWHSLLFFFIPVKILIQFKCNLVVVHIHYDIIVLGIGNGVKP